MNPAVPSRTDIRVAFDTNLSHRNSAGTGRYARELIAALRSLGVDVRGLDQRPRRVASSRPGRHLNDLAWTQHDLPRHALSIGASLLHCPAFFAPVRADLPVVVTVFDALFLDERVDYSYWWRTYLHALLRITLPRVAGVLTISEYSKSRILSHFRIPDEKVTVTYPGVDHSQFRADGERWCPPGGGPYLLYVGALAARKDVGLLYRAFAQLRKQGSLRDHHLVIVGDRSPGLAGAEDIGSMAAADGLWDSVHLLGHVPDSLLPLLYRGATALVLPSRSEGFGLSLVEAMACGTPPIAFDLSSAREVVGDGGILVPVATAACLASHLQRVVEDDSWRATLRTQAHLRSRRYTWENCAAGTLEVYQRALKCG